MKQMPVESFFAWVGSAASRASLAHARLLDPAEREQRGGELPLAQRVQEVALVLGGVHRAQQPITAVRAVDAGIVAGGDLVGAQRAGLVQEGLELDLAIAQHVGVRRAPGAILGEEVLEHAVPVFRGEVARVERNAESATHGHGVLAIGVGGAGTAALVLLPVLHEQAFDLVAGLLQQQRGDRGVDAAGNAQHHLHGVPPSGRRLRVSNGNRWPPSHRSMLCRIIGLRRRSPSAAISARVSHRHGGCRCPAGAPDRG